MGDLVIVQIELESAPFSYFKLVVLGVVSNVDCLEFQKVILTVIFQADLAINTIVNIPVLVKLCFIAINISYFAGNFYITVNFVFFGINIGKDSYQ